MHRKRYEAETVIINGRSRRCVWWWSKHLQDEKENEHVRVVKIEGLASENIYDLLCEIEGQGLGTRCKNPLWIAAINPGPKEQFSEQDRDRAREILEQERGYQGQPYFMVEHEKKGWKHWHVIYSRIDAEHMRVLPDALDAKVCHAAARRIESEFGLAKVIGPFDREPGMPRPPRAPEPWEMYRGMQTKIDPREIEAEVTGLFRRSETGKAFQAALESHGYQLATGQRGLLILDSAGKEHSLARRIDGINTKELNAFMRDVDRQVLPTVEQAKEQYQERKIAGLEADRATVRQEIDWEEALAKAAIEKERVARNFVEPKEPRARAGLGYKKEEWPIMPPQPERRSASLFERAGRDVSGDKRTEDIKGPVEQLWSAWCQMDIEMVNAAARQGKTVSVAAPKREVFAAALDEKGFSFAVVTKDEADRSQREWAFAREIGRYKPRFKENEIVLVTEPRNEYRRNGEIIEPVRIIKLDQSLAEKFVKHLGNRSQLQGIEATIKASDLRAQERAAERDATRAERAADIKDLPRNVAVKSIKTTEQVGKKTLRSIGKTLDAVSDAFASLFAPVLTPEQIREGEKATDRRGAESNHTIDLSKFTSEFAQQRQVEENERNAERQLHRDGGGRER